MDITVYDEDFIKYMKSRKKVSVDELDNRFGEESNFLIRIHQEGGYIKIKNNEVYYRGEEYRLG